jgi:hypothetical protein
MSDSATKPGLQKLAVPLAPILPRLELAPGHQALLDGAMDAAAGLDRLAAAGAMPEAVRLVAHALPRREAVWWCCMCARGAPDPNLPQADAEALLAAEAWVRKPGDAAGRAAMECAQRTAFRSPEAWAAVAAFWCGESMAPVGQPAVPAAPHMPGVAVAGGVVLAAVRYRPERAEIRFSRFLAAARDIAVGGAGRIPPEEG